MRMILVDKFSPLFAALQRSDPTTNLQDYLMLKRSSNFADLHSFEKVLYTLKEEQLGFDELQLWPDMVSLLFFEIIRYTRLNLQEIQSVPWPVSLYKLIHREDIINNLMQQDSASAAAGPLWAQGSNKGQQRQSISLQGKQLMRQQSVEIKKAMLKKRNSLEYALRRHESNVFNHFGDEQVSFAAQLIDEELQQTKA